MTELGAEPRPGLAQDGVRPPTPLAAGAPRLIVEVRSGPRLGDKAILEPGGVLRVGRTERADLAVDTDPELSAVHFELTWDGEACALVDCESALGTKLGGRPIEGRVEVAHGAWIQAGKTSFSVYVEARTPPREAARETPRARGALAVLRPKVGGLFAVLDAARDRRVRELCHEHVDETRSLYEGTRGEALADVAPYLVHFAAGSGLLERLVTEGWGKSWGVFLESRAPVKAVRRQLRRSLIVATEEEHQRFYFRFYDPRVLRAFLPLANVRQADEIFGEIIDAFVLEAEDGEVTTFAAPSRAEHAPHS